MIAQYCGKKPDWEESLRLADFRLRQTSCTFNNYSGVVKHLCANVCGVDLKILKAKLQLQNLDRIKGGMEGLRIYYESCGHRTATSTLFRYLLRLDR